MISVIILRQRLRTLLRGKFHTQHVEDFRIIASVTREKDRLKTFQLLYTAMNGGAGQMAEQVKALAPSLTT